jgi:hypothetical protein
MSTDQQQRPDPSDNRLRGHPELFEMPLGEQAEDSAAEHGQASAAPVLSKIWRHQGDHAHRRPGEQEKRIELLRQMEERSKASECENYRTRNAVYETKGRDDDSRPIPVRVDSARAIHFDELSDALPKRGCVQVSVIVSKTAPTQADVAMLTE